MPVDRRLSERLARSMVDLYGGIAERLAVQVARRLDQDIGADDDRPERRLAAVRALTDQARQLVNQADSHVGDVAEQMVVLAQQRGTAAARAELGDLAGVRPSPETRRALPGAEAAQRLIGSLVSSVRGTHTQLTRWPADVYREVTSRASVDVLAGVATRRRAAQRAWEDLVSRGVTGFVDRSGRGWALESYVDMASRTITAQAAVEAHLDRLGEAGLDLVIVSNAPQECRLCLVPGTVVEGPAPTGRTRSEYTGDVVSITTASGKHLTGTPDHPVLTPLGWRRLKDLHPGDEVINHSGEHGVASVVPDDVQVPSRIEVAGEGVAPLLLAGPTRRHFDNDRSYREVRAVFPDGFLLPERDTASSQPLRDLFLVSGIGAGAPLLRLDDLQSGIEGQGHATRRVVGRVEQLGALFGRGFSPAFAHGSAAVGARSRSQPFALFGSQPDAIQAGTGSHSRAAQVVGHDSAADAVGGSEVLRALTGQIAGDEFAGLLLGQLPEADAATDGFDAVAGEDSSGPRVADVENGHELMKRLAGTVAADEVVRVDVRRYSGHVWDLTTDQGWFVANGIVTHNCRPWEGKVLTRDGAGARTVEVEHATRDGEMVQVAVAGSVDDAVAAGLMHPACRHSLSGFQPGVTQPPTHTADPEGDQARQRLRRLERQVRRQKLIAETALTDDAREAARRRVRATQAQIRDHVDVTGLHRQRYREQLRLGHTPPPGQAPDPPDLPPAPSPPSPSAPATPRRLSPEEAIDMQDQMVRDEPWTRRQMSALSDYTGLDYLTANVLMRGGEVPPVAPDELDRIREMINDAAAGLRPLPEPVRVTRRTGPEAFGGDTVDELLALEGATRQEPAFLSTSIDQDIGAEVGPVLMEIDVPAGTPAAYVEMISEEQGENELLLAPGRQIRIRQVRRDGDEVRIEAEVLSDE